MELLKIDSGKGLFLAGNGEHSVIDQITKEDLLRLVELVLKNEIVELDEYSEELINNKAQQVVYKSIYSNLQSLKSRRSEFIDESRMMYIEEYKRYMTEASQPGTKEENNSVNN